MLASRDTGSCTIELLDTENMGIAVEILMLCALEFEICLGGKNTPQLPANVAKKSLPGQGLRNSTCQGQDRQGQGQGLTSLAVVLTTKPERPSDRTLEKKTRNDAADGAASDDCWLLPLMISVCLFADGDPRWCVSLATSHKSAHPANLCRTDAYRHKAHTNSYCAAAVAGRSSCYTDGRWPLVNHALAASTHTNTDPCVCRQTVWIGS